MKNNSYLIQYIEQFNSPEICYELLSLYKWKDGFKCRRCECTEAIKGRTIYHRRCKYCHYDESCTAHTLFHKIKFPITKAFAIVFQMATMKKGLSSCEISRQYGITQETAWFFAKKVRLAMHTEIKSLRIRRSDSSERGLTSNIHMTKNDRAGLNAGNIHKPKPQKENLDKLISALLNSLTEPMLGPNRLKNLKNKITGIDILRPEKRGNRYLHELHLLHPKLEAIWPEFKIYNLKSWMIGIHHRITVEHLPGYLAEFSFRLFNRTRIFSTPNLLIRRFVKHCWQPYVSLIAH
jgi:hypothetical protein